MRNERASQLGAGRPKCRCLADSTIDEASLSAACRSMARRPRRCADAAHSSSMKTVQHLIP